MMIKSYIISEYDIRPIKDFLLAANEEVWLRDTFRQELYDTMVDTHSILIIFSSYKDPFDPTVQIFNEKNSDVIEIVKPLIKTLENNFDGNIIRFIIAKLKAHKSIIMHDKDGDVDAFRYSRRLHLPIVTDENVEFIIDDERIHFKEGIIYELNNLIPHGVENNSDNDRIHIIIDLIEKKDFSKFTCQLQK